jgi:hypothetical protein
MKTAKTDKKPAPMRLNATSETWVVWKRCTKCDARIKLTSLVPVVVCECGEKVSAE